MCQVGLAEDLEQQHPYHQTDVKIIQPARACGKFNLCGLQRIPPQLCFVQKRSSGPMIYECGCMESQLGFSAHVPLSFGVCGSNEAALKSMKMNAATWP